MAYSVPGIIPSTLHGVSPSNKSVRQVLFLLTHREGYCAEERQSWHSNPDNLAFETSFNHTIAYGFSEMCEIHHLVEVISIVKFVDAIFC